MASRNDRFLWKAGEVEISQCVTCAHNTGNGRCLAFTEGIPVTILRNKHDHRDPYPGDRGMQFEPLVKTEAEE